MAAIPDRKITPPVQTPETTSFWSAASEGRLLLRRCTVCRKPHFYPRTLCPFCLGKTDWEQASGRGEIYSYSIMRHAPQPYVIAYVRLDEGPTMMTNVVDCDFDDVRIGQKVRLVFKSSDGGPDVPMFTLA
ncbi:MAG: Zn-ribbon domain-containing OB-fold protein [Ottowia sp.]|uniref:Zn-ribbon domain-containing OB-fold protein n=1 Tax=unclassified Ottowia TaxID=2645081 RepID=UPI003C2B2F35